MRKDTEIGIIAGIVLAITIGVFISTRTGVREPEIPLSHKYEGKDVVDETQDLGVLTQQTLPEIAELPEERPVEAVATAQAIIQREEGVGEVVVGDEWEGEVVEDEWGEEVVEGKWEEIEPPPATVGEEAEPDDMPPAPAEGTGTETAVHAGEYIVYKVKPNDTLSKLARQYYGDETKWTVIYDANAGKITHRNALYVGQEIIIPDVNATTEEPVTVVEHLPQPSSQTADSPKEVGKLTHTVQRGDTLFKLARQYYNDEGKWGKIYDANRDSIPNPNAILRGTVLIIPE
jgi:nucleoid-associated protein YgaU